MAARTVYPLAVALDLAVKDGVLVLGQHLLFAGHLELPAHHLLHRLPLLRKRRVERVNDGVDAAQALALPVLLVSREPPWDFPVAQASASRVAGLDMQRQSNVCAMGTARTYQSRPPESGFVRRKGPNMAGVCC